MKLKDKRVWAFLIFAAILAWCGRDGVRSALASGIQALASVGAGGTGLTSVTSGGLLVGQGTSPLSVVASPADNTQALCGSNPPAWGTTCKGAGGGGNGGGPGILTYSGPSLSLASTQYFPPGGGASASGTETNVDVESPAAVTISKFYVQQSAAPGVGNSTVYTWRKNAMATTLTCTISGNAATSCNDTAHSFTVIAGDLIDVQAVTTGTPSALTVVMATQYGAVGASTSSGTFATAPAAGTAGAVYFTTNSSYILRDNGATLDAFYNGSIVTPPANQSLTLINQGSATMNTTNGYGYINDVGTGGYNMRAVVMTLPATPYNCILGFRFTAGPDATINDFIWDGIVLRESATSKLQIFGQGYRTSGSNASNCPAGTPLGSCENGAFISISDFTNATTYSVDLLTQTQYNWSYGDIWLRVTDDGTTRKYFVGPGKDAIDFQIASEAHAGFFTTAPNQFGYGFQTNYGSGVGLSLKAIHLGCPN